MPWIHVSQPVAAEASAVFAVVSDIRRMAEAVPWIVEHEFLTEQRSGVGTRFREVRERDGRRDETELEVTECEPPRHVRMLADSHGTVWDSVFRVEPAAGGVTLHLEMDARPHKLLPKLMVPLIKGMVRRSVAGDLAAIAEHCEGAAGD